MRAPREEPRDAEGLHLAGTLLDDQIVDRDEAGCLKSKGWKHQVDPVEAKREVLPQQGQIGFPKAGTIADDERPLTSTAVMHNAQSR